MFVGVGVGVGQGYDPLQSVQFEKVPPAEFQYNVIVPKDMEKIM